MHALKKSHGFIRVLFALLFTVAAVLWIFNHKQEQPGTEDLSAMTPLIQHTQNEEPVVNITLEKTIGLDSLHENDPKTNSIRNTKMAEPVYYGGVELDQSPNKGRGRSMSDLIKCIASLQSAETYQLEQSIRHLWVVAADLGAPEEALNALEDFLMEQNDMDFIELAEFAIADLHHVLEIRQSTPMQIPTSVESFDEDQPAGHDQIDSTDLNHVHAIIHTESNTVTAISQEQMDIINEQALFDPDPLNRKNAIQTLSILRNDATVDTLMDAADDPEPTNRYLALQALWLLAADGVGDEDEIGYFLQKAQGDNDLRVGEIASAALTDLEHVQSDFLDAER